ncbi:MAG TPA: ORF6N domain-containing protein [Patescibacteria group bacterium]|nr:ORF6N domain-containing protein [Patescibacteria group bacterium]
MKDLIVQEIIEQKIYLVRGQRVMLDRDLALLYEITTGNFNKAVSRNLDRFPSDFMFRLNKEEFHNLIFQFGTSRWGGTRKNPRVFTEHGILMLSSVLNSKRATQVNIQIMRTFIKMREMLVAHKDILKRVEEMEKRYDRQFRVVFQTIKKMMSPPNTSKRKIGFKA